MDPDNDVLVLFLTSHGSQDGLEVQNGSLPLAQLAPADLRELLDACRDPLAHHRDLGLLCGRLSR